MNNFSAIILAGGKSSRMGKNKALLQIYEKQLIDYSIAIAEQFSSDIIIASSILEKENFTHKIIPDVYPNSGALGGIYSGLCEIKNDFALVLPCDSPFVSSQIINKLIHNLEPNVKALYLRCAQRNYPLIGFYNKSLTHELKNNIKNGHLKVSSFLEQIDAQFLEIPDSFQLHLTNINTTEDFENAKRRVKN